LHDVIADDFCFNQEDSMAARRLPLAGPQVPYMKFRRVMAGWRISDLAERTGINRTIMNNIEIGRVNATPDELRRIAAAFNLSPKDGSTLMKTVTLTIADPDVR
jgi:transcriptional regulator with XRE-family HTH domain